MDLEYLGTLSFNYAGIALLSGYILNYVGITLFPGVLRSIFSPLGVILAAQMAFLVEMSVMGLIGTAAYYFYRKRNSSNPSYNADIEKVAIFLPILLTPLLTLGIGLILWIIGKLR